MGDGEKFPYRFTKRNLPLYPCILGTRYSENLFRNSRLRDRGRSTLVSLRIPSRDSLIHSSSEVDGYSLFLVLTFSVRYRSSVTHSPHEQ